MKNSSDSPVNALNVDEQTLQKLLAKLDAESGAANDNRRRLERYEFRQDDFVVRIRQPGATGVERTSVARPRNLSALGISFIHRGFVHDGSTCIFQLVTLHGTETTVAGTVIGCRYLAGQLHEVRVRFDRPIEPSHYCKGAIQPRILLAEDDAAVVRMTEHMLSKLGSVVTCAENGEAAVEMARNEVYDLIIMDINMPVLDGLEATRKLRELGYSGRIVAGTGLTQPEDRDRCLQAGCNDYMAKPYTMEGLERVVTQSIREPIWSSLAGDPQLEQLINAFVSEMPATIRKVQEAASAHDEAAILAISRSMKGAASSYGFEVLTETAQGIEQAVIDGLDADEVRSRIAELVQLCMRVRGTAMVEPEMDAAEGAPQETPAGSDEPDAPDAKD